MRAKSPAGTGRFLAGIVQPQPIWLVSTTIATGSDFEGRVSTHVLWASAAGACDHWDFFRAAEYSEFRPLGGATAAKSPSVMQLLRSRRCRLRRRSRPPVSGCGVSSCGVAEIKSVRHRICTRRAAAPVARHCSDLRAASSGALELARKRRSTRLTCWCPGRCGARSAGWVCLQRPPPHWSWPIGLGCLVWPDVLCGRVPPVPAD